MAAVAGVGCFISSPALAQASFWDEVRDPRQVKAQRLLATVERARIPADDALLDAGLDSLFGERALVMLELAGADALPDVRLQYLLGESLVAAAHYADGRDVLLRAIRRAPRPELWARAWFHVAIAAGAIEDRKLELDAYTKALQTEWRPEARAVIFLNRGEALVAERQIERAYSDFHSCLGITQDPETRALALWSLGVALDRDHNLPLALARVRDALVINLGSPSEPVWAIDSPNVMFHPSYEHHYYRALAFMARAWVAQLPERSKPDLEEAISHWDAYLEAAGQHGKWSKPALRNRRLCAERLERETTAVRKNESARRRGRP